MQERRKSVRTDGLVLVNYKIPDLQMEGKSAAFDVSAGGVRMTVDKKLKTGTLVELEIYLPGNSQPIIAKGEVVWAEKSKEKVDVQIAPKKEYFYAGIKFSVMDENNTNRIIDYIHRRIHQTK